MSRSWWEILDEEKQAKGWDDDLIYCLIYNSDVGFTIEDVARVHAVVEGERDGMPWHWLLALNDGRIMRLYGYCDYTGWDCQSGAMAVEAGSLEAAAALPGAAFGEDWREGSWREAGRQLSDQLASGKLATWREQMNPIMKAQL